MQNSRKKIIFLDGNYSGGGEGDEGGTPSTVAGVVQSGDQSGDQNEVSSGDQSTVTDVGQSGVAGEDAGVVGDQKLKTMDIQGNTYIKQENCKKLLSSENPNNPNNPDDTDQEEESQTEEGLQVQEGGDYDYDLLSEGGRSSIDSASVVSSVATNDLLSVDPLYIRLTKFLETSNKMEGGSTANIADLLYEVSSSLKSIKVSFQEINSTLQKLAVTKASQ